jgi:hypothetical protein
VRLLDWTHRPPEHLVVTTVLPFFLSAVLGVFAGDPRGGQVSQPLLAITLGGLVLAWGALSTWVWWLRRAADRLLVATGAPVGPWSRLIVAGWLSSSAGVVVTVISLALWWGPETFIQAIHRLPVTYVLAVGATLLPWGLSRHLAHAEQAAGIHEAERMGQVVADLALDRWGGLTRLRTFHVRAQRVATWSPAAPTTEARATAMG